MCGCTASLTVTFGPAFTTVSAFHTDTPSGCTGTGNWVINVGAESYSGPDPTLAIFQAYDSGNMVSVSATWTGSGGVSCTYSDVLTVP